MPVSDKLRNGAAREAANKLESSGFKIGDVKQAVTQTASRVHAAGSRRGNWRVAGWSSGDASG